MTTIIRIHEATTGRVKQFQVQKKLIKSFSLQLLLSLLISSQLLFFSSILSISSIYFATSSWPKYFARDAL